MVDGAFHKDRRQLWSFDQTNNKRTQAMKTETETRMPQNCIFHEQNHREEVLEQLRYDSVDQPRSRLFSSTKGGTEGKRALGTRLTNKREFVFVFFVLK